MHKIQYRLLTICLIWLVANISAGCGNKQVTFVTEASYEVSGDEDTVTDETSVTSSEAIQTTAVSEEIPVYVCGAVNSPGVYYLTEGSLKQDALMLAGGFTEDADREYVNLAEYVSRGEKIYFPTEAEVEAGMLYETFTDSSLDDRVNINTATKEQLMSLPGIGESKAEAILSYRKEHGAFASPEDLLNISGIKDGVYQRIKDYIVVD